MLASPARGILQTSSCYAVSLKLKEQPLCKVRLTSPSLWREIVQYTARGFL